MRTDKNPEFSGMSNKRTVVAFVDVETQDTLRQVVNQDAEIPDIDDTVQLVEFDEEAKESPLTLQNADVGRKYLVVDRRFVYSNTGEQINELTDAGEMHVIVELRPKYAGEGE